MNAWWASLLALAAVALATAWRAGPRLALGTTVALSLLVPTWLILEVAGFPVHLRFAATLVALGLYCAHPRATFTFRLTWIDAAGLGLLAAHVISDWSNEGIGWRAPLRAYGEWFVPYVAGRLALQSVEDVRRLLPVLVGVSGLLAAGAVVESLLRFDVWPFLFGEPPVSGPPPLDAVRPQLVRWGIRRASGPTMNPIFFGLLQLLLFPWTAYAASQARRGCGPAVWWLAPWAAAVGILATVSRSAQAGLLILLCVMVFVLDRRWRPLLAGAAVAAVLLVVARPQAVVDAMARWGGQPARRPQPTIALDGARVASGDALYRVHLLKVYATAAHRAGPFGFGTAAVTGFPINVPVGAVDPGTLHYLRFVDNAHLLMLLRFGYLGAACFLLLGIAGAAGSIRLALAPGSRDATFHAASGAAIVALMVVLLAVWMPQDFGYWYLWTIGGTSGLSLDRRRSLAALSPDGRSHRSSSGAQQRASAGANPR